MTDALALRYSQRVHECKMPTCVSYSWPFAVAAAATGAATVDVDVVIIHA